MSHSHLPSDDERLIARLGAVAHELDPPPALVYELGRQAYQLHRIDDELVELVADSLLDAQTVRAAATDVRLLSFESAGVGIELEISREGPTSSVLGQLTGDSAPVDARARLEAVTGEVASAPVDADGRFEFVDVPRALVRLRLESSGAPGVSTSWVAL